MKSFSMIELSTKVEVLLKFWSVPLRFFNLRHGNCMKMTTMKVICCALYFCCALSTCLFFCFGRSFVLKNLLEVFFRLLAKILLKNLIKFQKNKINIDELQKLGVYFCYNLILLTCNFAQLF